MRQLLAPLLFLFLPLACSSSPSRAHLDALSRGESPVRIVDESGKPVAHAEVLAGSVDLTDPAMEADARFAGVYGALDRYGRSFPCDERGEVVMPREFDGQPVVARSGSMWGCDLSLGAVSRDGVTTILVVPDESARVVAVDREGRPAPGAWVWVSAEVEVDRRRTPTILWTGQVERADGSIDVPHARHWRDVDAQGFHPQVLALTIWGAELDEKNFRPFPPVSGAEMRFVVSPSGGVDVVARAADGSPVDRRGVLTVRRLEAGKKLDEAKKFLIAYRGERAPQAIEGVPIGNRYELVLSGVEGWSEARATFDGPKKSGERVRVELVASRK